MLDLSDAPQLSERTWLTLPERAKLPCSLRAYMAGGGEDRVRAASRRRYQRASLRSIAIGMTGDDALALYMKDVSRMGVGFYAPKNLLPQTLLKVWLPTGRMLSVKLTRCRRLGEGCFECGAAFDFGADGKSRGQNCLRGVSTYAVR